MTDEPELDALLAAAPALTGIPAEWWGEAVRTNLRISLRLGQLVLDLKLPDGIDPAPVFRA